MKLAIHYLAFALFPLVATAAHLTAADTQARSVDAPDWAFADARTTRVLGQAQASMHERRPDEALDLYQKLLAHHRFDVVNSTQALCDLFALVGALDVTGTAYSRLAAAYFAQPPCDDTGAPAAPSRIDAEKALLWSVITPGGMVPFSLKAIRSHTENVVDENGAMGLKITLLAPLESGRILLGGDLSYPFGDAIHGTAEAIAGGKHQLAKTVIAQQYDNGVEIEIRIPSFKASPSSEGNGSLAIAGDLHVSQPLSYSMRYAPLAIGSMWTIQDRTARITSLIRRNGGVEVGFSLSAHAGGRAGGSMFIGAISNLIWLESSTGSRCLETGVSLNSGTSDDYSNWTMFFAIGPGDWRLACLDVTAVSSSVAHFIAPNINLP